MIWRSLIHAAGLIAMSFGVVGCAVPGPATPPEAMVPLRRSLSLNGGPEGAEAISYLAAGDPMASRLILIHGTPGAAVGWADFLVDPSPGVETVALDRQADAVGALMPDDHPSILLGHSLGGPIAALAAARHPEQVCALTPAGRFARS